MSSFFKKFLVYLVVFTHVWSSALWASRPLGEFSDHDFKFPSTPLEQGVCETEEAYRLRLRVNHALVAMEDLVAKGERHPKELENFKGSLARIFDYVDILLKRGLTSLGDPYQRFDDGLTALALKYHLPRFELAEEARLFEKSLKDFTFKELLSPDRPTLRIEIGQIGQTAQDGKTDCSIVARRYLEDAGESQTLFEETFAPNNPSASTKKTKLENGVFDEAIAHIKKLKDGGTSFKLKDYYKLSHSSDGPKDLDDRGVDLHFTLSPDGHVTIHKLVSDYNVLISFKAQKQRLITKDIDVDGVLVFEKVGLFKNLGRVVGQQGLLLKEVGHLQNTRSGDAKKPSLATKGSLMIQSAYVDNCHGTIKGRETSILFSSTSKSPSLLLSKGGKIRGDKKASLYAKNVLQLRHGNVRAGRDLHVYSEQGIHHSYMDFQSQHSIMLDTFGSYTGKIEGRMDAPDLRVSARSIEFKKNDDVGILQAGKQMTLQADERITLKNHVGEKKLGEENQYLAPDFLSLSAPIIDIQKLVAHKQIYLNVGSLLYPEDPFLTQGEIEVHHRGTTPLILKKKFSIPGFFKITSREGSEGSVRIEDQIFAQKGIDFQAPRHKIILKGEGAILASEGPMDFKAESLELLDQAWLIAKGKVSLEGHFKNTKSLFVAGSLESTGQRSFENLSGNVSVFGDAKIETETFHQESLVDSQTTSQTFSLSETELPEIFKSLGRGETLKLEVKTQAQRTHSALFEVGGDLKLKSKEITNKGGLIRTYQEAVIGCEGELLNENVTLSKSAVEHGHIIAMTHLLVKARNLTNKGRMGGRDIFKAYIAGTLLNEGGLESNRDVDLRAQGSVTNAAKAEIRSGQDLSIKSPHITNISGHIESARDMWFEGRVFENTRAGTYKWNNPRRGRKWKWDSEDRWYSHDRGPGTIVAGRNIQLKVTKGTVNASHMTAGGKIIGHEGDSFKVRNITLRKATCVNSNRKWWWEHKILGQATATVALNQEVSLLLTGAFFNAGLIDAGAFYLKGQTFFNGVFGNGEGSQGYLPNTHLRLSVSPGAFDARFFSRDDQDPVYVLRRKTLFGDLQIGPSETLASSGMAQTAPLRQFRYLGDYAVLNHALQTASVQQMGRLYFDRDQAPGAFKLSHMMLRNTLQTLDHPRIRDQLYQDFTTLQPFQDRFRALLEKPIFWPRLETKEGETYITFDLILPDTSRKALSYDNGTIRGGSFLTIVEESFRNISGKVLFTDSLTAISKGELHRETKKYTREYDQGKAHVVEEVAGPQERMACENGDAVIVGREGYTEIGVQTSAGRDLLRGSTFGDTDIRDQVLSKTSTSEKSSGVPLISEKTKSTVIKTHTSLSSRAVAGRDSTVISGKGQTTRMRAPQEFAGRDLSFKGGRAEISAHILKDTVDTTKGTRTAFGGKSKATQHQEIPKAARKRLGAGHKVTFEGTAAKVTGPDVKAPILSNQTDEGLSLGPTIETVRNTSTVSQSGWVGKQTTTSDAGQEVEARTRVQVDIIESTKSPIHLTNVDWAGDRPEIRGQFKETYRALRSWSHSHTEGSLMDPAVSAVIGLAISLAVCGVDGGASAATGLGFAAGSVEAAVVNAGLAALATQATVSCATSGGDLERVFEDVTSRESLRSIAQSMVTAGVVKGLGNYLELPGTPQGWEEHMKVQAVHAAVNVAADVSIGGQDIEGALKSGLQSFATGTVGGVLANEIGKAYGGGYGDIDPLTHKVLHGLVGGLMGAVSGKNPKEGALSGAVGAIVAETMADFMTEKPDHALTRMIKEAKTKGQPLTRREFLAAYDQHVERNQKVARLCASFANALVTPDEIVGNATAQNAVENNLAMLIPLAAWLATAEGMTFLGLTGATLYAAYKTSQENVWASGKKWKGEAFWDEGEEKGPSVLSTPVEEEQKPKVHATPVNDNKTTVHATPIREQKKIEQEGFAKDHDRARFFQDQGFQVYDGPDFGVLFKDKKEWEVKRYDKVAQHPIFGKFFRTPGTMEWWTKDNAGHAGSVWKVFKETSQGLEWHKDTTKHGDFLKNKHKGEKGKFIPWRELILKK